MKRSTRFLSVILAALFCAASLAACTNNAKPPVTDVKTDAPITDAPATIAPVTDVTTDAPTTEAPETTVTSEATTTETTDISTTTDAITTEGAETSDTSTADTSTTAAPATDAPSVTTEAPVTVDPVTTEVSVTTEVPASTQVVVTTDALVTTEVPVTTNIPETTAPDEKEVFDTYGKSLAEILYKTDSGEVKIRGNSSFTLPSYGMYLINKYRPDNPPTFVVKDSPKLDGGPRIYTPSNTKQYPEYRPDQLTDKNGNAVNPAYKGDYDTLAGMKCHFATGGDKYYIVTVFSDNAYNVCEIPGEVIRVNYYNKDIGFLICKNTESVYEAYCTYDGGKTYVFLQKLCSENWNYLPPILSVSNTGMFYVSIDPRIVGNSSSATMVFEVQQGQIDISKTVDLNSVYLRKSIEQNLYVSFVGNIGIWARYQSHYTSDRAPSPELHYIYYCISTDGGKTWQRYDPAIVGITIEETVYH